MSSTDAEKKTTDENLPEIPLEYVAIGTSILAVIIAGGLGVTWWLSDQSKVNARKQQIAEQKRMMQARQQWEEQLRQQQNPEWPNSIDRNTVPQQQQPALLSDGHRVVGGVLDTGDGYNEYGNYGNYANEEEQYVTGSTVNGYREPMPQHYSPSSQSQQQPRIKSPASQQPKPIGNKISKVMSMDENDNYPVQQNYRQGTGVQDGSEADDLSDII